jgi:hypothetical protein
LRGIHRWNYKEECTLNRFGSGKRERESGRKEKKRKNTHTYNGTKATTNGTKAKDFEVT